MTPTYTLDRSARPTVAAPTLDESQQRVVDHRAGPLLVLAGPGTGKTTTLVEAVVDRIERRGVSPDEILVLTFSRKAAEQLRDNITARLGRTLSAPIASTFHSFAYGLIKANQSADTYDEPLRLLSAPEQDVVMRELLSREAEAVEWPATFAQAIGTRGFTREVQAILARAREKGLEASELAELARAEGHPEWHAAARFLDQYLTILDNTSSLDYPELIFRAVLLAEHADLQARLRQQYSWVFVDEYQDTDPSQVRLLQAIAGDGRNLVVVGDPDQSIYAFRGAEVRGILDFPGVFRARGGEPAEVVALTTTRRFGSRLLRASRAIVTGIPATGSIPAEPLRVFRDPSPPPESADPGTVEVCRFDTVRAEYEHLADRLRRAHLDDGLDWSEMAVLVRSGRSMIPGLRRALVAGGVPIEVATDETPLVGESAVAPLLDAMRVAVHYDNADRSDPDYVDPTRAEGLLLSPLGNLDAAEIRFLARKLRAAEREAADADDRAARSSSELVRAALFDPSMIDADWGHAARKAVALAQLLRDTSTRLSTDDAGDVTAEDVLWKLWSSTTWPERLRAAVDIGGPAARLAHRDLDAVCALFELAARAEEQRGHTSVVNFLEALSAQQIPADTLADRGVRGSAVRLLTAHRAKGLEWQFVVVCHVQEGSWPDLRRRSTLLQADRIGADGVLPATTTRSMLAEERRLFYVACTRARSRLLVTAVRSPEDDGEQPSRFIDELNVAPRDIQGRPPRPMSLAGLVSELRRTASDPDVSDALRSAAVRRLARLATETHHDVALVPQADPATWWGTRARSRSEQPLRPTDAPVTISASALESLLNCPARWFLEREAGGRSESSASQGFGLIVHTLADRLAKGELSTLDDLMAHVDKVWPQLTFRTPWSRGQERAEIEAALGRLLRWHERGDGRRLLATEHEVVAIVSLAGGERVRLKGYVDRLEIDADGAVWVVDLKTGKYPPTDLEIPRNPQLGLYQLAVDNGAVDDLVDESPAQSGGAELVQLRKEVRGEAKVQTQTPQQPADDGRLEIEAQLTLAVDAIRSEAFPARLGAHCKTCSFEAICPINGAGTVLS